MEEISSIFDEDEVLQLPDEVFINIFRFVDSATRENVRMVCTRFNELLCQLEKDKNPLDLCLSQISDDETFESIVSTRRRFSDLTINLAGFPMLSMSSSVRIKRIVAKFGPRLKKFKFRSLQLGTSKVTETQLVDLLLLLPNVEEIALLCIDVEQDLETATEFKMPKLKKLLLNYCNFERPLVLECFPKNVLQELVFTFYTEDETQFQTFFNRQANIKKLEMYQNERLKFDHMALEHLKISSNIDFKKMIRQQPKLRYLDFAISWIKDDVFAALCKLKHLQVLRTSINQVSCHEFKSLQELTHLKELRIESSSYWNSGSGHLLELSMMKCMQLEKLSLLFYQDNIPQEILIQISNNFRHLKHLEFINHSSHILNTVLENFPNLESLLLDFKMGGSIDGKLIINEDFLGHEKLKQLVITGVKEFYNGDCVEECVSTKSILKLVRKCPNLERIMLPQLDNVKWDDFLNITENTKLTHLSMKFNHCNTLDFSKAIECIQASKSLRYVSLRGVHAVPIDAALRVIFKAQFQSITHNGCTNCDDISDGDKYMEDVMISVMMKKRNEPEWSFNLHKHFSTFSIY